MDQTVLVQKTLDHDHVYLWWKLTLLSTTIYFHRAYLERCPILICFENHLLLQITQLNNLQSSTQISNTTFYFQFNWLNWLICLKKRNPEHWLQFIDLFSVLPSFPTFGETLTASSLPHSLSTPFYPLNYHGETEAIWHVQTSGQRIITFKVSINKENVFKWSRYCHHDEIAHGLMLHR